MLNFFQKLFESNQSREVKLQSGLYRHESHDILLAPYADAIKEIYELTGLSKPHFDYLYLEPLKLYAEYMQKVPASEAHHHSMTGGMLKHTIEILINALRLRRGVILPPGVTPEEIEPRKDVWTFAVYVCALLHDVGKIITDLRQVDPGSGLEWHLMSPGHQPNIYQVKFNPDRKHKFHEKLPAFVLYKFIKAENLIWIMRDPEAFEAMVNFMIGDHAESVISPIIQKADQASVIANLGGDLNAVNARPAQLPLSERIVRTIRNLIQENALPINRKGAAGFVEGDWTYFVSKRTLDAVKERMRNEGQSVPNDNIRIMDELQQFEVIIPNDDKAIWKVKVTLDGWEANLSMLKLPVSKVWPDLDGRPTAIENLSIELVDVNGTVVTEKVSSDVNLKPSVSVKDDMPTKTEDLPEQGVEKTLNQENTAEDEIGTLDDLLSPNPESELSDLEDFSDFNDDLEIDYSEDPHELNKEEVSSEIVEPISAEDQDNDNEPEMDREQILAEIHEKASTAKISAVVQHNNAVIEDADQELIFEDPDSAGALFVKWMVEGLKEAKISANQPSNMVHRVKDGLFLVSPAIFRACERDTGIKWDKAQRELQRKKINLKTDTGLNIFEYRIISTTGRKQGKVIKGLLIPNPSKKLGFDLENCNEWMEPVTKIKLTSKSEN